MIERSKYSALHPNLYEIFFDENTYEVDISRLENYFDYFNHIEQTNVLDILYGISLEMGNIFKFENFKPYSNYLLTKNVYDEEYIYNLELERFKYVIESKNERFIDIIILREFNNKSKDDLLSFSIFNSLFGNGLVLKLCSVEVLDKALSFLFENNRKHYINNLDLISLISRNVNKLLRFKDLSDESKFYFSGESNIISKIKNDFDSLDTTIIYKIIRMDNFKINLEIIHKMRENYNYVIINNIFSLKNEKYEDDLLDIIFNIGDVAYKHASSVLLNCSNSTIHKYVMFILSQKYELIGDNFYVYDRDYIFLMNFPEKYVEIILDKYEDKKKILGFISSRELDIYNYIFLDYIDEPEILEKLCKHVNYNSLSCILEKIDIKTNGVINSLYEKCYLSIIDRGFFDLNKKILLRESTHFYINRIKVSFERFLSNVDNEILEYYVNENRPISHELTVYLSKYKCGNTLNKIISKYNNEAILNVAKVTQKELYLENLDIIAKTI